MTILPTQEVTGEAISPEKLNKKFIGEDKSPEQQVEDLRDPRLQEEWTFDFSYTDQRGRTWQGEFTNKILNLIEIPRVAAIRSQMLGNIPIDAADYGTYQHTHRLAHMTISLINRPRWAEGDKLGSLYDPQIVSELFRKVASHEAIFFGRDEDQEASSSGTKNANGKAKGLVEK